MAKKDVDKIIIMLTHNDVTVKDAYDVFDECKDLPIKNWGFKNVGLPYNEVKELAGYMKMFGKTTTLEVVTYDEESCLAGAKMAVECGFDRLCGTLPYESVIKYCKENKLEYYPFVGEVAGSPSVLTGPLEKFLEQDSWLAEQGVEGVDLLLYRYADGDPEEFAKKYLPAAKLPTILAGSVSSPERIRTVLGFGTKEFTMGSALFTKNFVKDGTFRENLEKVIEIIEAV